MAKIEQLEPRIFLREQLAGASESAWRRSIMPSIRWGAVIAGVAVGLSLQLALVLFGMASGLTSPSGDGSDSFGLIPLAWLGIGMLAAACVGGFIAGRMSGLKRKVDGLLHGAVAWAVLTIVSAALAGYGGAALSNTVMIGKAPMTVPAQEGDYSLTLVLRGLIGGDASAADVRTLERYIRSGQKEEAILLLSAIGMEPVLAVKVVDQAIIAAGYAPASSRPMFAGSDRSTDIAAWLAFGSIFLSLLAGMGGGLVGVLGSQRLPWSKPVALNRNVTENMSS